jgi:hypothetical protein
MMIVLPPPCKICFRFLLGYYDSEETLKKTNEFTLTHKFLRKVKNYSYNYNDNDNKTDIFE